MNKLSILGVVVVASITVAACGKKKQDEAPALAKTTGAMLLSYVPADSPYVYAALEPSPADLRRKLEPLIDASFPVLKQSLEAVAQVMDEESGNDDSASVSSAAMARNQQLMNALAKRMTPDMPARFGFSAEQSVAVFYGHGVLPVARVVLADPDRFRSEFAALIAEMEIDFEQTTVEGLTYDRIPLGEAAQLLVAQQADMLVAAISPADLPDDALAMLLGASKPAESMADGKRLEALAEKYKYLPQGLGWIDVQALAAEVMNGPTGMNKAVFDLAGPDAKLPELSDVCKQEAATLVAIAPRLTIGYTRVDADAIAVLPVLELRKDVAAGLKPVAGMVPGLTADADGLMKFGVALDLKALREYAEQRIAAISAAPFQCPELAAINLAAAQLEQTLKQPVPPIVYNFKGFFVDIASLDGIDFSSPTIPDSLDLSVLLAFDNVNALLQMGQMMLPPLAAIELSADGKAVAIPQEMLAGYGATVFAAMTNNLLAFGSGDDSDSRVSAMVQSTDAGEPAFMAMSVDLANYTRLMNDIQQKALADLDDADDAESTKAAELIQSSLESNRRFQAVYADIFDREQMKIVPTDNGFEVPTTVTLQ